MMIPVPEKQAVWGFFPCFWESKANLSTKNVLLTWGNWQVLHMWELFDCTAYNCINSELLPGSWFLNVPDCDLHFLIHQNTCHLRALRSFIQEPSWVGFTCYHILHWKGSKVGHLQGICWAVCSWNASCSHLAKLWWWDPPSKSPWNIGMPQHSCSIN